MTWTAPMTFVANTALTAAQLNQQLRDNLNETMPAKAATVTGYFVVNSTAPTQLAERVQGQNTILQSESTASVSYVDLDTVGPQVTMATGTRAITMFSARMYNGTLNSLCVMSYGVSGASAIATSDTWMLAVDGLATANRWQPGMTDMSASLTAGSNTFTCQYRTGGGGTGYFGGRRILVWPF